MPVSVSLEGEDLATCVIASEDKGRFIRKDPVPRQPSWWDQPVPKDNPLRDVEIAGSGTCDPVFREPWDGFLVAIRSNLIESVQAFVRDLFGAGGEISAGNIVLGVRHGAEALNRLFGPEERTYLIYWQFTFDIGPSGVHYVLVQHRNRYRAVLRTSLSALPPVAGVTTTPNTVDFRWRWKEQVQIRGVAIDCDTEGSGSETTEITANESNAALLTLQSQQNVLVEVQSLVSLYFAGLTAQLRPFEERLRHLFDKIAGGPDGTPPPQADTAGVMNEIRGIARILDALIRTWEGEIELQTSWVELTCLTKAAYDRIGTKLMTQKEAQRAAREATEKTPLPAEGKQGGKGKASLPGAKLGHVEHKLVDMKPGDDAVYFVPTAWSPDASGELVGRGYRHVRVSMMREDEVDAFNKRLVESGRVLEEPKQHGH